MSDFRAEHAKEMSESRPDMSEEEEEWDYQTIDGRRFIGQPVGAWKGKCGCPELDLGMDSDTLLENIVRCGPLQLSGHQTYVFKSVSDSDVGEEWFCVMGGDDEDDEEDYEYHVHLMVEYQPRRLQDLAALVAKVKNVRSESFRMRELIRDVEEFSVLIGKSVF